MKIVRVVAILAVISQLIIIVLGLAFPLPVLSNSFTYIANKVAFMLALLYIAANPPGDNEDE